MNITSISPTSGPTGIKSFPTIVTVYGSGFSDNMSAYVGGGPLGAGFQTNFRVNDENSCYVLIPDSTSSGTISIALVDNGTLAFSELKNCFTYIASTTTPIDSPSNPTPVTPVPTGANPFITGISPNPNIWKALYSGNVVNQLTVTGTNFVVPNSQVTRPTVSAMSPKYGKVSMSVTAVTPTSFKLDFVPNLFVDPNPINVVYITLIVETAAVQNGVLIARYSNESNPGVLCGVARSDYDPTLNRMRLSNCDPANNQPLNSSTHNYIIVKGQNIPIMSAPKSPGSIGYGSVKINGQDVSSYIVPNNSPDSFRINLPLGIKDNQTLTLDIEYLDDAFNVGGTKFYFTASWPYTSNGASEVVTGPAIAQSVSPSSIPWGSPTSVTINGVNFYPDSYIRITNGTVEKIITPQFGGTTSLTFNVNPKDFYPNQIESSSALVLYLFSGGQWVSVPGILWVQPSAPPVTQGTTPQISSIEYTDFSNGAPVNGIIRDGRTTQVRIRGSNFPPANDAGTDGVPFDGGRSGLIIYRGTFANQTDINSPTNGWTNILLVDSEAKQRYTNLAAWRVSDSEIIWRYNSNQAINDPSQDPFLYNYQYVLKSWEATIYGSNPNNYPNSKESNVRYITTTTVSSVPAPTISNVLPTSGRPGEQVITIYGSTFRSSEPTPVSRDIRFYSDSGYNNFVASGSEITCKDESTITCKIPSNLTPGSKYYIEVVIGGQKGNWGTNTFTAVSSTTLDTQVKIVGSSPKWVPPTGYPRAKITISGSGFKTGGKVFFGPDWNASNSDYYLRSGPNEGDPAITSLQEGVNILNNGKTIEGYVPVYVGAQEQFGGSWCPITYVDPSGNFYKTYQGMLFIVRTDVGGIVDMVPTSGKIGDPVTITNVQNVNMNDLSDYTPPGGSTPVKSIAFGENYVTSSTILSSDSIQVTVPAGSSTVEVSMQFKYESPLFNKAVVDQSGTLPTFTYQETGVPYISGVSPSVRSAGQEVTIFGGNFNIDKNNIQILFGDIPVPANDILDLTTTAITVKVPPQAGGGPNPSVWVYYVGGNQRGENAGKYQSPYQFKYGVLEFIINAISPNQGAPTGNFLATITGEGFIQGVKVRFGTVQCQTVTYINQNQIQVVVPAAPPGVSVVDVTVYMPDNSASQTLYGGFTYTTRVITGGGTNTNFANIRISRSRGSTNGGSGLTGSEIQIINNDNSIVGTKFGSTPPLVRFGGQMTPDAATINDANANPRIITILREPAHVAGIYDITIAWPGENPSQYPLIKLTNVFEYVDDQIVSIPTISSVTGPDGTGDISCAGGELITIKGNNFSQGGLRTISVNFSPNAVSTGLFGTNAQVVDDNTIICFSPKNMTVGVGYYVTVTWDGTGYSAQYSGLNVLDVPFQGSEFILEVGDQQNNTDFIRIFNLSDFELERSSNATPSRLTLKINIDKVDAANSNYKFSSFQKIRLLHQDIQNVINYGTGKTDGITVTNSPSYYTDPANYPDVPVYRNNTIPANALERDRRVEKWFTGFITSASLKTSLTGRYWEIIAEDALYLLSKTRLGQQGRWRSSAVPGRIPSGYKYNITPNSLYVADYTKKLESPKGKNAGSDLYFGASTQITPITTKSFLGKERVTNQPSEEAKWMITDLILNLIQENNPFTTVQFPSDYTQIPNSKPTQYDFSKQRTSNILDGIRKIMNSDPFLYRKGDSSYKVSYDDIVSSPERIRSGVGGELQMRYFFKTDDEGVVEYFRKGSRNSRLGLYRGDPSDESYLRVANRKTHSIKDDNFKRVSDQITRVTFLSRNGNIIGSYNINSATEKQWSIVDNSPGFVNEKVVHLNIDIDVKRINADTKNTSQRFVSSQKVLEAVMPMLDALKNADSPDRLQVTVSGDPRYMQAQPTTDEWHQRLPMAGEVLFVNIDQYDKFRQWYVINSWKYSYPENSTEFSLGKPASLSFEEIQKISEKNLETLFNKGASEDTGWIPTTEFFNNTYILNLPVTQDYVFTVTAAYQDPSISGNKISNDSDNVSTTASQPSLLNNELANFPNYNGATENGISFEDQVKWWPSLGFNMMKNVANSSNQSIPSVNSANSNNANPYQVIDRKEYDPEYYGSVASTSDVVTVKEYNQNTTGNVTNGEGYVIIPYGEGSAEEIPLYAIRFVSDNIAKDRNKKPMTISSGFCLIRIVAEPRQ